MSVLAATGDRLRKPGKERQTLVGTLKRGEDSTASPVSVVRQYPDRLRVVEQVGGRPRVTIFDGEQSRSDGAIAQDDEDILETLVYDSVDHFLHGQAGGAATRFLGAGFRPDAGADAEYAGPLYDVFEVTEQVRTARAARTQVRCYYFNSVTRLLERVRYEIAKDGAQVKVEVMIGEWQTVSGERVPARVVRLEDGVQVLAFTFSGIAVGPRADDALFTP